MLSQISTIYLYLLYLLQGVGGQQCAGSVRDCVPAAVPLHVVVPPGAGLHQPRPHRAGQCAHVSKYFSSSEIFGVQVALLRSAWPGLVVLGLVQCCPHQDLATTLDTAATQLQVMQYLYCTCIVVYCV